MILNCIKKASEIESPVTSNYRLTAVYQGILKFHKNSETPKKKPKGGELTLEEKTENRRISRERILVENINAKVKVFKIAANKYRNRRKRFALRMSLICGIINFELNL